MAQQNKNYQGGNENAGGDEELKKKLAGIFEEDTDSDEISDPVTKIYVAGNEYNSMDEIPPEERDKMSETLLQVHQESSKAEDLGMVFKKQKKLRSGTMLFGDRAEHYSTNSPNFGRITLVIVAVVLVIVVLYVMLMR